MAHGTIYTNFASFLDLMKTSNTYQLKKLSQFVCYAMSINNTYWNEKLLFQMHINCNALHYGPMSALALQNKLIYLLITHHILYSHKVEITDATAVSISLITWRVCYSYQPFVWKCSLIASPALSVQHTGTDYYQFIYLFIYLQYSKNMRTNPAQLIMALTINNTIKYLH